jgi:enoyl-CoA hydratase
VGFDHIIFEKKDGLAWIKLDRPKVLNALSEDVYKEMNKVLDGLESDSASKVIIITGEGKAFAAGADIQKMLTEMPDGVDGYELSVLTHRFLDRLSAMRQPTIAAINGLALGGGLEMALACDFRIASEDARLGLPEVNLGLIPGGSGTQRLQRIVGLGWAKQLVMTGEPIDAEKALRIGLVTQVVPLDQLIDAATELAHKLVKKPAYALLGAKVALDEGGSMGLSEANRMEQIMFGLIFSTGDRMEGLKSFVEKRKPNYKGR